MYDIGEDDVTAGVGCALHAGIEGGAAVIMYPRQGVQDAAAAFEGAADAATAAAVCYARWIDVTCFSLLFFIFFRPDFFGLR